jgi:hypothetical protein
MRAQLLVFAAALLSGASAVALGDAPMVPAAGIAGTVSAAIAAAGGSAGGGMHAPSGGVAGGGAAYGGAGTGGVHSGGVVQGAGMGGGAMGQTWHGGLVALGPAHASAAGVPGTAMAHAVHGPISPGYAGHTGSVADGRLNAVVGAPAHSAAYAVRSALASEGKDNRPRPPSYPLPRAFYGVTHDPCENQGGCPPPPVLLAYGYGAYCVPIGYHTGGLVPCWGGAIKSTTAPGPRR